MAYLDQLLKYLRDHGGSDLHLAAGLQPRVRVGGTVRAVDGTPTLTDANLRAVLQEIASPTHWAAFETTCDADFAYGIEGVARFRANYFVQENGAGAVFRIIPEEIQSLETLEVPATVQRFTDLRQGLVLVTGPTGSGKSTTLAAIIDRINSTAEKHILTIEDPIEFVHQNKRCVLSQREVHQHTESFGDALRVAIRQNPDVILVGEMRDRETIGLAITAAEMGVLVFGTLHTNSAVKTMDRLIDAFPAEEQEQIRLSLSESLAGVVSQLLLRTTDGKGRCAATEIMVRTTALPNIIREGNTPMLNNLIQNGKALGMCTMDDSLMALLESKRILPQDAYMKALDKARFEKLLPAETRA
jgi:twitching motility protein PilT